MKVSSSSRPLSPVQPARAPERSAHLEAGSLVETGSIGTDDGEKNAKGTTSDDGFRLIYDRWFEDVARWIRALGGLDADREDILQEVFMVVQRRLASFDGSNPAGWLYRITRRQVRDFRRRIWVKHIFNKRRSDEPDILPHRANGPAAVLEQKERRRVLHALLQKMNDGRRSAFVLFEIEGLSGEEIARIQNIPLNTVWTRLHHARKEFFALVAKYQRTQDHETVERTHDPKEGKARL